MASVARAGPHRRVKDDEVVAHYARAGDGSPGVIRIGQLAERVVVALPRLCILRTTERPPPRLTRTRKSHSAVAGRESAAIRRSEHSRFQTDAGITSRSPAGSRNGRAGTAGCGPRCGASGIAPSPNPGPTRSRSALPCCIAGLARCGRFAAAGQAIPWSHEAGLPRVLDGRWRSAQGA